MAYAHAKGRYATVSVYIDGNKDDDRASLKGC